MRHSGKNTTLVAVIERLIVPKNPVKNACLKEFLKDARERISTDALRRSKSTNDVQEIAAKVTWSGYVSEVFRSIWQCLTYTQPLIQATSHVIATMAYVSLALSITYSAVVNLALLQMPFWLYVTMLVLIAITEFAGNMVDWYMKLCYKTERFSDQKILSIERRLLLHPDLKKYAATESAQKVLEQFAAYLYLERDIREEIQHTIAHENHAEGSEILQRYDKYPVELQCRLALAMSPNKEHMRTNESQLSDIYKNLKETLNLKNIQHLLSLANSNDESRDNDRLKGVICMKNVNQNVSIQHRIALEMTLRFATFAVQYNDALNPRMTAANKNKILKWQLNNYLDKRSRKELNLLTVTQSLTGLLAKIIVWGSTISRGLLVVANAPIQLISQLTHVNINALTCIWFFFSGWFTGVSSENTKKCVIKINRSSWTSLCEKLKSQLCNPWLYVRFMIMAAASISSCYFSAFSFRRLLDDPEGVGAICLMRLLAQIIAPMILPMLSHFWWVFTAISTMINLYVDCKYYISHNNEERKTIEPQSNQDITMQKKQNNWIQLQSNRFLNRLPKVLMACFRVMSAIAMSALTYVSISRVGGSRLWAMLLSSGTALMRYAKLSNLQIKMQEVDSLAQSALSIMQPFNWHSDVLNDGTGSSTEHLLTDGGNTDVNAEQADDRAESNTKHLLTNEEMIDLRKQIGRRGSWPY